MRIAVFVALSLLLTACAGGLPIPDDVELKHVAVNEDTALATINAYRAQHRLPPLSLSSDLERAAQQMADHIAGRDRLKSPRHSVSGLMRRLDSLGIRHDAAAENLGYGYPTFARAFAGWQGSADHDRNLLNPNVTEMGIARTTRADGKWRNFWALIMARPD